MKNEGRPSHQDVLHQVTIKYLTQVFVAAAVTTSFVWVHAQLTDTNTAFFRAAGLFMSLAFLILAYATNRRLIKLAPLLWSGYIVLASYFVALMAAAAVFVGPEPMLYLVSLSMAWAGIPYFYAYIFLGTVAERVSLAYAAVISIECIISYAQLLHGGQQDLKSIQPYFSTFVAQWCYIVGQRMVPQIYTVMNQLERQAVLAREALVAMAGHEIRTPLQSIISCVDLLALKVDSPLAVKTIERMRGSCVQMENVLNNASGVLRSEGGDSGSPSLHRFDLYRMLQQVVEDFAPRAKEKGLTLAFDCSQPIPSDIQGDQHRMLQVVNNLVSNGIKYTEHGRVTLRAVALCGGQIRLTVSDTGIGIPQEHHDAIFEPFYRSPAAKDRAIAGSGLGLAVVRREVGVMGGTVSLSSVMGEGSVFIVDLPVVVNAFRRRRELVDFGARAHPAASLKSMPLRVLVIDDSEDIRVGAKDLLQHVGVICETAASGEEALRFLRDSPVDVVFLDLQMPGMNGYDVVKAIRYDALAELNRYVPVVAISANEPAQRRDGSDLFTDFARKPLHLSAMAALMRRLVGTEEETSYTGQDSAAR